MTCRLLSLTLVLAFSGCRSVPQTAKRPLRGGLFCTTNTSNWAKREGKRVDLFTQNVDGVLNYATWRSVEPTPGKLVLGGFERMAREAAATNKLFAWHIISGMHAPDWVFTETGVKPFSVTRRGRPRRAYLPWIEHPDGTRTLNTPFLRIWQRTVQAYAQALRAHPQWNRIWYVAITGWPESNGLELMWAADSWAEFEKLRWEDGGRELYIEFCCRVVDIYLDAFPDMPLGLAYTDWYGKRPNGADRREMAVSRKIVDYALAEAKRRGGTVVPMGLWTGSLGVVSKPNHPLHKSMYELAADAPAVALEGPMGSRQTSAKIADQLTFARRIKPAWVQLWHHDVLDPEAQETLTEFRRFLNGKE